LTSNQVVLRYESVNKMGQNGAMAQKWDIVARDMGQKYQETDL
jgi:hypothetical protein